MAKSLSVSWKLHMKPDIVEKTFSQFLKYFRQEGANAQTKIVRRNTEK